MILTQWINFSGYTFTELSLYFGGMAFWFWTYFILIKNTKHKFVEMPVIIAAANVAWEFDYGFLFDLGLGDLMQWLYRAGAIMDFYIFYFVIMYGSKQVTTPWLKKHFKPIIISAFFIWGILIYAFNKTGYDLPLGSHSAYWINLMISTLYIVDILRTKYFKFYSFNAGIGKMFGTGLITVFCFVKYPTNYFVQVAGVLCFILDFSFLVLFKYREKKEKLNSWIL